MRPYAAYHQQTQPTLTRVDMIIELYRKALTRLDRAQQFLGEQQVPAAALPLSELKLIISSLAAGLVEDADRSRESFARLYEFVLHQLDRGPEADLDACRKVLQPLLDGFEAVRDQAAALEMQGSIPSLSLRPQVELAV